MMDSRRTVEPTWTRHVGRVNGPDFSAAMTAIWFILGLATTLWLSGILSAEFRKPLALGGDHLFLLVQIKSFLDGYGLRLNPSLGFPGVQDNLLFPQFELSHRALLFLLSKISGSIFVICNLFYAISVAAMFASSFVVLRMLSIRAWLAALASVVYVVSPYFVLRSGGHDFLALYFAVPLGRGPVLPGCPGRNLRRSAPPSPDLFRRSERVDCRHIRPLLCVFLLRPLLP